MEVLGSRIAAKVLESGQVVGVGSSGEARQDALLGKEERSSADGKDSSLSGRVALLKLREVGNETERLELLLNDFLGVTTDDDKDIIVLEAVMGLLIGDLRTDNGARLREDLGLGANNGDFKSLGACEKDRGQREGSIMGWRVVTHPGRP